MSCTVSEKIILAKNDTLPNEESQMLSLISKIDSDFEKLFKYRGFNPFYKYRLNGLIKELKDNIVQLSKFYLALFQEIDGYCKDMQCLATSMYIDRWEIHHVVSNETLQMHGMSKSDAPKLGVITSILNLTSQSENYDKECAIRDIMKRYRQYHQICELHEAWEEREKEFNENLGKVAESLSIEVDEILFVAPNYRCAIFSVPNSELIHFIDLNTHEHHRVYMTNVKERFKSHYDENLYDEVLSEIACYQKRQLFY